MVDVVCNLAEQDPFLPQHTIRFPEKRREGMGECVALFLWGTEFQAETVLKVFLIVPSLIRNVRWIIYHYIKTGVSKRHTGIVSNQIRVVLRIKIHACNRAFTASPKPAPVNRRIQNLPRSL